MTDKKLVIDDKSVRDLEVTEVEGEDVKAPQPGNPGEPWWPGPGVRAPDGDDLHAPMPDPDPDPTPG